MDPITADLLAYYEQEAPSRAGRRVDPQRTAWRSRFVEWLRDEGRTDLIEVGCGPGRDAPGLRSEGLNVVGLDLSFESCRMTLAAGVPAVQGSLYRLPIMADRYDALWSMSTLVHVPDARFDRAMGELCAVVRPGGLVALGLWGGIDSEGLREPDAFDPPRFFSSRSHDRLQEMLGRHGTIELFETKAYRLPGGGEYQFVVLRVE
ncbi:MAG: class I SAM-dependent methyltransferase [Acidimicrobiales bacterium]